MGCLSDAEDGETIFLEVLGEELLGGAFNLGSVQRNASTVN
jgi:hypothetical protein